MSVFKIKNVWYYNFVLDGRRYSKSTGKTRRQDAIDVESAARQLLVGGHQVVLQQEQRARERQTVAVASAAYPLCQHD